MSGVSRWLWLSLPVLVAASWSLPAGADFDPSGRGRKPGVGKPGVGKPGVGKPGVGKPSQPKPKGDDDDGKKPEVLIARYTAIVLAQPAAPFPQQRLSQLYRERDGNLKKLIEDFEQRAEKTGDEAWNAKVALAGFLKLDGRYDEAIAKYEAALTDKPKESAPLLALAQLELDRGDKGKAKTHYEKALGLLKEGSEIEQTTRVVMNLCVELKDFEAARTHHAALVKRAQGSLFVKAELGRALFAANRFDLAEAEFRELVKASAGDNRALAPALRDLGNALAKQKKTAEAQETLKKALNAAAGSSGVRAEVLLIMAEAFRSDGKLADLIAILEKEQGADFQRMTLLGALYEETGQVDKALAIYRKALASNSSHVDTRVRVVHLLQTAGDLEAAIKEYEALIRAAPHNADFVFELCETLIQRGDRPKALKLLKELEGRAQDADVLAAVADFYERVEEKELAMTVLQRLAGGAGADPTFLVDLGDRYYQAGDKKKAMDTWARIRTVSPSRARANVTLGEVYLDHDMADLALEALREAVSLEPKNLHYKKSLAIALERAAVGSPLSGERFGQAIAIWQELLSGAGRDQNLAREARSHIVSIWSVTKELATRAPALKQKFEGTPPDLEAGRLLAEVLRKLGKLPEAELALREIVKQAPGDESSLLLLERVLIQQQNLSEAIKVLEKLAEVNDKAARQYYQRMAQYSAELYRDDDAIRYAAKAVELSPEDAGGHQKLGDMYKKKQDFPQAMAEYRKALSKNDRLWPVYFELAELLLTSNQADEADRLFRRVVRASGDEELVARAARMSLQINLGKGSLEVLERELLPVAVGNPQKPIYRRLLVELYGVMTLPLVQTVRHNDSPAKVKEARDELTRIGSRAVKPLLDALADDRETQQRVAIEILSYVENKNAGPTLHNFAMTSKDKELAVRAMVAVGALADPNMLPKLSDLLFPKGELAAQPSGEVAVAASWAVARTKDPKAEALLVKLLSRSSPELRTIAAVGLAQSGNPKFTKELLPVARAIDAGPLPRAAALLALGRVAAQSDHEAVRALAAAALESADPTLRRAGMVVFARLSKGAPGADVRTGDQADAAMLALAQGMLSGESTLVRDAIGAAAAIGKPQPGRGLPVVDGSVDAPLLLDTLMPKQPTPAERAALLETMSPWLVRAARQALLTSPARALPVASAFGDSTILGPFAAGSDRLSEAARSSAQKTTEKILEQTLPSFAPLLSHPDRALRSRAATVVAKGAAFAKPEVLIQALGGDDEDVRRAVLGSLQSPSDKQVANAVAKLGQTSEAWPTRVRVAEALGRFSADHRTLAAGTLTSMATDDSFAIVRGAALEQLKKVDPEAARPVLARAAQNDADAFVRSRASELLQATAGRDKN